MNRAQLVDSLAKATGQSKANSERWLQVFLSTVSRNMKRGVKLVGFGTFGTVKRKARLGRNPQTGDSLKIPARVVPVFKAGAALKNLVGAQKK
jgi:DNA-binding protein HU-beta